MGIAPRPELSCHGLKPLQAYRNGDLAGALQGWTPNEVVRLNNFIGKSNWAADQ